MTSKKKFLPLPPQSRLRELFLYDPETGILTFARCQARMKAGDVAGGAVRVDGHWRVSIDGTKYTVHRVIWCFVTGDDPDCEIDHKDTQKFNNRWNNLRLATSSQNKKNSRLRSDSTSGFKGVSWSKRSERWVATITSDGKQTYLGLFDTAELAYAAYLAAAKRLHGAFARAA